MEDSQGRADKRALAGREFPEFRTDPDYPKDPADGVPPAVPADLADPPYAVQAFLEAVPVAALGWVAAPAEESEAALGPGDPAAEAA